MKLNYIVHLLTAILFFTQTGFAAPAEAEYKIIRENRELFSDGSQEYHYYHELTLFTHTAMNSTYGETFITYNPQFQKVKIHTSYTKQKDGTVIKTPANAFVEVLARNAANMPDYNHLKEIVIVHTGLELGATIVLDYSIVSKPGYLPEIDVCKTLQKSSPVKEYEISFTFPKEKKPHYTLLAAKQQPEKSVTNDRETIRWRFRNIPASSKAPGISLQNEDIPGLLFTTYTSPGQALKVIYDQFNAASDFKELASLLTKDKNNDLEKVTAIHQYVLTHIASSSLPAAATGYRIRPAEKVIRSAYATEPEKINILAGLLKAADIEAYPVAAYYMDVDPEYCTLSAIGKWAVIAKADGHSMQLDALSVYPAATDCNFMLKLENGDKITNRERTMKIRYTADIRWNDKQPKAKIEVSFNNDYLSYSPDYTQGLIRLKDMTYDHTGESAVLKGETDIHTQKATDNTTLLSLPETLKGIARYHYDGYNSKREHNLLLPALFDESYDYTLTLDDNMQSNNTSFKKEIENSVGKLVISLSEEKDKIAVHRSLKINKRLIIPSEYADFRQLMTEWGDEQQKLLIITHQ